MREISWPLIQGVPRIWPNGLSQCHYCLGLFRSRDRRRCYCSEACRRAMHNAARRQWIPQTRRCPVCGRRFTAHRPWQRWCSPACRKLAWYRRQRGLPVDPLSELGITDIQRPFPSGTVPWREQRRAEALRDKRYRREEQQFRQRGARRPWGWSNILKPGEPLPARLAGRIAAMLADETDSRRLGLSGEER